MLRKAAFITFAILPFLSISAFSASQMANNDRNIGVAATAAPQIVDGLRGELARSQSALVEAIARAEAPERLSSDTAAYVNRLRDELRATVLAVGNSSGELDLAVRRAAVRDLLGRIEAYESAYGLQDGARTTRLNVLSDVDLKAQEARLEKRLSILLSEEAHRPTAGTPLALRGRILELQTELKALQAEQFSRTGGTRPVLVSITTKLRVPQKAEERIRYAESSLAAERYLLIEVEERLAWNPQDVRLKEIRTKFSDLGFNKWFAALVRSDAVRDGWPPGRGEPPGPNNSNPDPFPDGPDGPKPPSPNNSGNGPKSPSPNGSGGAAVSEARMAAAAEVDALVSGNHQRAADAAARLSTATEWMGTAMGQPTDSAKSAWELAAASMADDELREHKAKIEQWRAALLKAKHSVLPHDWHGEMDLRESELRLRILASEITIRGPPPPGPLAGPHGPDQMSRALALAENGAPLGHYKSFFALSVEHRRLIELQNQLSGAPPTERPALQDAVREQITRRMVAEAQAIDAAYREALDGRREAYRIGRGTEGARAVHAYDQALDALRRQSGALHALAQSYIEQGIGDPGGLRSLPLTVPAAPNATIADYRPDMMLQHAAVMSGPAKLSTAGAAVMSGHQVTMAEAPPTTRFDTRFRLDDLNSAAEFRKFPQRAPGGVVVDVVLGDEARRIAAVRYDAVSHRFLVLRDGRWLPVAPSVTPEIARAAMGFVLDRRVAAVDIGGIDWETVIWLTGNGILRPMNEMTREERKLADGLPKIVRVVRINPALDRTEAAVAMIAADELIFSALSLDPVFRASHSVFRGLDTTSLRARYVEDRRALQGKATSGGYKSVLTVDRVSVAVESGLMTLRPRFDYAVYLDGHLLPSVGGWFAEHDDELREGSPELRQLEAFAAAVALIRSVQPHAAGEAVTGIQYIVDDMGSIPSFLCRSETAANCAQPLVKELTETQSIAEAPR